MMFIIIISDLSYRPFHLYADTTYVHPYHPSTSVMCQDLLPTGLYKLFYYISCGGVTKIIIYIVENRLIGFRVHASSDRWLISFRFRHHPL